VAAAGVLASSKVLRLSFSDEAPSRANAHNTVLRLKQQLREAHERLATQQRDSSSGQAREWQDCSPICEVSDACLKERRVYDEEAAHTTERCGSSHALCANFQTPSHGYWAQQNREIGLNKQITKILLKTSSAYELDSASDDSNST
jgi:hypothetical protein